VFVYYQHHDQSVLAGTKSADNFVSYLAQAWQCEALNIIWDFALAGKHRFLDRPASRARPITAATGAFLCGTAAPLQLDLRDGRRPLIADVLEAGISFWRRWLQDS
jgi:hypothetical protein